MTSTSPGTSPRTQSRSSSTRSPPTTPLAPHDISIILHIMKELPQSVNCRGGAHIVPGIEDVTSMSLHFSNERSAIIHSSWNDPRKVREMTIVGSKRMIVYDDILTQEKIKIFDARVEQPPHYDTFAEFQYAYHYGDIHSPYVKQDEPLKTECQHFLESIWGGKHELEQHVVRCADCAAELKAEQDFHALLAQDRAADPTPNLVASSRMRLQEALETAKQGNFFSRLAFDPAK